MAPKSAAEAAKHQVHDVPADPKPPAPPEAHKFTTEQLKALGATFTKEQAALDAAEAVYEKARARRSDAVKAIVEACGHKGPFHIGGKVWNATERKSSGFFSMSEQSPPKSDLG